MSSIKIIFKFWKASIIQAMEYRMSFVFAIVANFFDFLFGLLQYLIFFTAAKSVAGWDSDQMLTLYAVFMNVFCLHFIFLYPNLVAMGEMVNSGNLDLLLTKPVSPLLVVSFRKISFEEIGSLFTANALLLWLFWKGALKFSLVAILKFLLAVSSSMALIYCLFVLLLCFAVKSEKLDNMSQLMWSLFSFCRYPIDIYPKWLRHMFFSVFPIAFISTVPAKMLLGSGEWTVALTAIGISSLFLFFTVLIWKKTIAGYTSAGG